MSGEENLVRWVVGLIVFGVLGVVSISAASCGYSQQQVRLALESGVDPVGVRCTMVTTSSELCLAYAMQQAKQPQSAPQEETK